MYKHYIYSAIQVMYKHFSSQVENSSVCSLSAYICLIKSAFPMCLSCSDTSVLSLLIWVLFWIVVQQDNTALGGVIIYKTWLEESICCVFSLALSGKFGTGAVDVFVFVLCWFCWALAGVEEVLMGLRGSLREWRALIWRLWCSAYWSHFLLDEPASSGSPLIHLMTLLRGEAPHSAV